MAPRALTIGALVHEARETCRPGDAGGRRYLGLEHIGQGSLRLLGSASADGVASATRRFREGDVLFGSLRPYFRKVALAPFDGVCSTDITVLRPVLHRDRAFAFYAIASQAFIALATHVSNGTRMPRAKWESLRSFRVAPLTAEERARRGEALARYDALAEEDARKIESMDRLVRALYEEWIVRRRPGAGEGRAGTWSVVELGALAHDVRDVVAPWRVPDDTPYFGLAHLPRRSIGLSDWGLAREVSSAKLRVCPGDILFGKIRPYLHKVGPSPVHAVCTTDALVVRVKDPSHFGLVLGLVSSDAFVRAASQSSQGTRMPRASWEVLARYPVRVPPREILLRLDAIVRRAVEWIRVLVERRRALAEARDRLLPRLVGSPAQ